MNYEEIVETRNGNLQHQEVLPYGTFYKKLVDKKYQNVIDIRQDLLDSLFFSEGLKCDDEFTKTVTDQRQLHFVLNEDSSGIYGLMIEPGHYQTFATLLDENPAVVAVRNFVDDTIRNILEYAAVLHKQHVYQVCYAPSAVFARKNDGAVRLGLHGSFYSAMALPQALYADCEDFVAPEVLAGGQPDERSDIYSIGKFIEFLYAQSSMPLAYRMAVRKATQEDPAKRYQTADAMLHSIRQKRSGIRSLLVGMLALAIAVIGVLTYIEMIPEAEDFEFVAPADSPKTNDPFSDDYDPTLDEYAGYMMDSDSTAADVGDESLAEKQRQMKEYEAKAEQIFRKQFTQEADKILSKIYDNQHMNGTEKNFMSASHSTIEELVKAQTELSSRTHLSSERTSRIASEIIEQLTNEKKKAQTSNGIQKGNKEDNKQH